MFRLSCLDMILGNRLMQVHEFAIIRLSSCQTSFLLINILCIKLDVQFQSRSFYKLPDTVQSNCMTISLNDTHILAFTTSRSKYYSYFICDCQISNSLFSPIPVSEKLLNLMFDKSHFRCKNIIQANVFLNLLENCKFVFMFKSA